MFFIFYLCYVTVSLGYLCLEVFTLEFSDTINSLDNIMVISVEI